MKITARDEYGLRILLRIARFQDSSGISIPKISEAEGLSIHNVGKMTRILRISGYINSTRGHIGGYVLAKSSRDIYLLDVLNALGGCLFDDSFCNCHAGTNRLCSISSDCSIRSLWKILQHVIDEVLRQLTLEDLIKSEAGLKDMFNQHIKNMERAMLN